MKISMKSFQVNILVNSYQRDLLTD